MRKHPGANGRCERRCGAERAVCRCDRFKVQGTSGGGEGGRGCGPEPLHGARMSLRAQGLPGGSALGRGEAEDLSGRAPHAVVQACRPRGAACAARHGPEPGRRGPTPPVLVTHACCTLACQVRGGQRARQGRRQAASPKGPLTVVQPQAGHVHLAVQLQALPAQRPHGLAHVGGGEGARGGRLQHS